MADKAYNPEAWRTALKSYMASERLSVNGWAKRAGISEGGFRNFLSGRNKSLSVETLEKLAAAVGLKHNEILAKLFSVDSSNQKFTSVRLVPVVTWLAAGSAAEVVNETVVQEAEHFIPVMSEKDTLIAVQVRGSSINRFIPDGSFAVIDPSDTDLVNGDFYALKNGDDEGTLKRYRSNPDRFEPYSTEPHETIFSSTQPLQIIGRVVQGVTPPPK